MRVRMDRAERGSQKWIQDLVNADGNLLAGMIRQSFPQPGAKEIIWLSPLQEDDFAEYRDRSFLDRLGLQEHAEALSRFWPSRGPQWDGLGRTTDGRTYFLIEAKANIPELISNCGAKSPASREKIEGSLQRARQWLNAAPHISWTTGFYQYANRLAHLFFLREIARVNAFLICLYFVADGTHQPTELEQWKGALRLQNRLMGLNKSHLKNLLISLFIHTDEIKKAAQSAEASTQRKAQSTVTRAIETIG